MDCESIAKEQLPVALQCATTENVEMRRLRTTDQLENETTFSNLVIQDLCTEASMFIRNRSVKKSH